MNIVFSPALDAIPTKIDLVTKETCQNVVSSFNAPAQTFINLQNFSGERGSFVLFPQKDGTPDFGIFGLGSSFLTCDPFSVGTLASLLPKGLYQLEGLSKADAYTAALALQLETYRFTRYKAAPETTARFILPDGADLAEITRVAEGVWLGRDLINTPANDLTPADIEAAARTLADRHGARLVSTVGESLLSANFPLIHAVGRAASTEPRLIDFTWGDEAAPRVTIVGKGVSFDTGGLNLKPDNSMLLMKKDMGGAASSLALAHMVMDADLPVRLRVLIPAVENSVSANAFRPGDVLRSRAGLSVEIGNTDAEGRLILADALSLADEEAPDLLIDYATLTGAARVALGPDLPPLYTRNDLLAEALVSAGNAVNDPVWRLPLWAPYDALLSSKIADVNHVSSGGFAGSITAALFLQRFVKHAKEYAHFDIYGWTPSAKPGRPEGGEVQGARLVYEYLKRRFT